MAGNNAIQILRGTSANIVAADSSTTLLAGQPLYNIDKNYLTIGAADGDKLVRRPVACREVTWYLSDHTDSIVAGTTKVGMLEYNDSTAHISLNGITVPVDIYSSSTTSVFGQSSLSLTSGTLGYTTVDGYSTTVHGSQLSLSGGGGGVNINSEMGLSITGKAVSIISNQPSTGITLNVGDVGLNSCLRIVSSNTSIATGNTAYISPMVGFADGGVKVSYSTNLNNSWIGLKPSSLNSQPSSIVLKHPSSSTFYYLNLPVRQGTLALVGDIKRRFRHNISAKFTTSTPYSCNLRFAFVSTCASAVSNSLSALVLAMTAAGITEEMAIGAGGNFHDGSHSNWSYNCIQVYATNTLIGFRGFYLSGINTANFAQRSLPTVGGPGGSWTITDSVSNY